MLNAIFFISALLFSFQDKRPEFKGGQKKLDAFIASSIVYPEFSKQNCLQGTIQVSFKLNRRGDISNSKIVKGYGTDLDIEALRVVRLTSGKWTVPANYDTTYALILPINFSLEEYHCEQRSKDDIKQAIELYKSGRELNNAIVNFYRNKEKGVYSRADESKILELKLQLGYDDRYIDQKLKEAQAKLKQGDQESACEDFHFIHDIGSSKADPFIKQTCQ